MTDTPRGAATPPGASSLSERRRSDAAATNPPKLTGLTPAVPAINTGAGATGSGKSQPALRNADAPSLNVTTAVDTPDLTPRPAQTATDAKLGRSGTVKKHSAGGAAASKSGPPKNLGRRESEGGYDAEIERHGQANDFVDQDSEEDEGAARQQGQQSGSELRAARWGTRGDAPSIPALTKQILPAQTTTSRKKICSARPSAT